MTRIEHANITVPAIAAAIKFLKIVAPDFEVRKDEKPPNSHRWVHIGNEEYYFALQEPNLDSEPKHQHEPYINYGVNHIGLRVSNINEIEKKLVSGGYKKSVDAPVEKYRKRAYYFDDAGFEWELVEYFSDKPNEKFLYE